MNIYERIFARLEELHMSQIELSRRTGIATSTISDWRKKKINPQADKLVTISKALDMSLVDLLCDEEDSDTIGPNDYSADEKHLLELFRDCDLANKRRIIRYYELLAICNEVNENLENKKLGRNVSVIQDVDGKNIVIINDIRFRGKRSVDWKEVRAYLKEFIGEFYTIASTGDVIYIGSDLPSEYTGSNYTQKLNGTVAKAKANAAQGIPEMIEISIGKHYRENNDQKHNWNAKNGWYRYNSRFALPVYCESGEVERYNIFHASMLIRHANDGKMFLYDIIDIKKETSTPLES